MITIWLYDHLHLEFSVMQLFCAASCDYNILINNIDYDRIWYEFEQTDYLPISQNPLLEKR